MSESLGKLALSEYELDLRIVNRKSALPASMHISLQRPSVSENGPLDQHEWILAVGDDRIVSGLNPTHPSSMDLYVIFLHCLMHLSRFKAFCCFEC